MSPLPKSNPNTRIGFHYFPDTDHYREQDLRAWLPELRALGASWLVLVAPLTHAIPEAFISGLIEAGIEPLLHFKPALAASQPASPAALTLLFNTYARWGVHYALLFDRPNSRSAWPAPAWAQADLVERFLDRFLPLAGVAAKSGLTPVFPALEPGGDYWDTAFLRSSLQAIERRGQAALLGDLALAAYALPGDCPLNWGLGGPERWPAARPYQTPPGSEDQRGFRIFDWYIKISEAVTSNALPLVLLGIGSEPAPARLDETALALRLLAIAQALAGVSPSGEPFDPIPPQVLAGCFWLLAADPRSPQAAQAWHQPNGLSLPVAGALRQWIAARGDQPAAYQAGSLAHETPLPPSPVSKPGSIAHYLLLPSYEGGIATWHLDAIRPYILRHHPTIGFSLVEAASARRVTVVGGEQDFPEMELQKLRSAGCQVERISGDGTSIASRLRES